MASHSPAARAPRIMPKTYRYALLGNRARRLLRNYNIYRYDTPNRIGRPKDANRLGPSKSHVRPGGWARSITLRCAVEYFDRGGRCRVRALGFFLRRHFSRMRNTTPATEFYLSMCSFLWNSPCAQPSVTSCRKTQPLCEPTNQKNFILVTRF